MVTLALSPVWNSPGPVGRYHIWSSGLVHSFCSKRLSAIETSTPAVAGVVGLKIEADPVGYGKTPVELSKGVAEIGSAGVEDRSKSS